VSGAFPWQRKENLMSVQEYWRLKGKGKDTLNLRNHHKALEYFNRAIKEGHNLIDDIANNTFKAAFAPKEIRSVCTSIPGHDQVTCLKCGSYLELAVCYSNRSLTFCLLKNYESALLDAEEVIRLAPEWSKVHFVPYEESHF
jgi:tetratricopeptide (TPR) repeat protein